MFEDDVYDLDGDGNLELKKVAGGWRIIDIEEPDRFKTVYTDKDEALDLCKTLNEGQHCIDQRFEDQS